KLDKCSPRQFRYLDYLGQFTTDIKHISGKDNVVADALSRVESVSATVNFENLARAQETDNELRELQRSGKTSLQLHHNKFVRHGSRKTFVFKDLATCSHMFVRADGSKDLCNSHMRAPHLVLARQDKFFKLSIRGREVTVSIDRLKPAYTHADDDEEQQAGATPQQDPPSPSTRQPEGEEQETRPVRRVRFPDRYQAGFG
ncbi:hypothetical protein NQ315_005806, partial [Exocentrus adspersus]